MQREHLTYAVLPDEWWNGLSICDRYLEEIVGEIRDEFDEK